MVNSHINVAYLSMCLADQAFHSFYWHKEKLVTNLKKRHSLLLLQERHFKWGMSQLSHYYNIQFWAHWSFSSVCIISVNANWWFFVLSYSSDVADEVLVQTPTASSKPPKKKPSTRRSLREVVPSTLNISRNLHLMNSILIFLLRSPCLVFTHS